MKPALPWLLAGLCALAAGGCSRTPPPAPPAASTESADQLVGRAWTDGRKVPLEGEQELRLGDGKTYRARVRTSQDGQVRIEYLNHALAGVTIWDDGRRVYRYHPRRETLTSSEVHRSADQEAGREQQLTRNYRIEKAGVEAVAGKAATVVELRPRSGGSLLRKLWIDPERAVILRTETRGPGSTLVSSSRYLRVEYLDAGAGTAIPEFSPPPALIAKLGARRNPEGSTPRTPAELSKSVRFRIREPAWLPPGYALVGAFRTTCACRHPHAAARLEYTDGLGAVSLFECASEACSSTRNCFAADADSPVVASDFQKGMYFLAVGDAPRAELQRLIRSAR
jgi:outer membrane lipoprotein-sorting protein